MTDKKLTDEEIIEALDLCTQQNGSIPCYDCPCWNDDEQKCEGIDYTATLGLINRQKAEIERLKGSTVVNNIMESQRIKREAKANAYKEFAEKLQAFCKGIIAQKWNEKAAPISWSYAYADFMDDIDNLLKEMVGEGE